MTLRKPPPADDSDAQVMSPIEEPADARAVDRWEWERTVKQRSREAGMPATTQHIGLLIASYTDAQTGGGAYPSVSRLVQVSGRGKDTVHKALRWLRTEGWLRQVSQGSGGARKASEYQLTLPKV